MHFLRVFTVFILLATGVFAQTLADQDYQDWIATANRAESVLETDKASDAAMDSLRTQIVQWRDTFLDAQSLNADRIATLQDQLTALPAAPEDGTTDPLADRRKELTDQIAQLSLPVLRAKEAFSRADSIVREIDRILSARRTDTIMAMGPSPLMPVNWLDAVGAVVKVSVELIDETKQKFGLSTAQAEIKSQLIAVIALFLATFGTWLFGASLARKIENALTPLVRKQVISHILSGLGLLGLRYGFLLLLLNSVAQLPIWGVRGALILDAFPSWVLTLLLAQFLARQIRFQNPFSAASDLHEKTERLAKLLPWGAGVVILNNLGSTVVNITGQSGEVASVWIFVNVVLAAWVLLRFVKLTVPATKSFDAENPKGLAQATGQILRRLCRLVGWGAPVLAALGFSNAASAIIFPTLISIALVLAILIAQQFVIAFYTLAAGDKAESNDSILPILISAVIILAALPIFALVWGARVTNLTEIWTRFQDGISLGGTQISPLDFLTFVLVFTVGYGATRLIQSALKGTVLPKTKLDLGAQNAIVSGFGYVGIFLAAMAAISSTGLDLSSLAIVAGALSVGIGFGLQNIVSNFVSGIILLIERPVTQGDWIEVGGRMGYVRDISVRSTRIETFDRTDVIIPNADLVSGVVTNWTRGNTLGRLIVPVGVAYGTDTRKVAEMLLEIAKSQPMVMTEPAPSVAFQGFGADSLDFEIRAILRDVNYMLSVKTEINHQIAERFVAEGIEIPFAQRDIYIKNIEDLKS